MLLKEQKRKVVKNQEKRRRKRVERKEEKERKLKKENCVKKEKHDVNYIIIFSYYIMGDNLADDMSAMSLNSTPTTPRGQGTNTTTVPGAPARSGQRNRGTGQHTGRNLNLTFSGSDQMPGGRYRKRRRKSRKSRRKSRKSKKRRRKKSKKKRRKSRKSKKRRR